MQLRSNLLIDKLSKLIDKPDRLGLFLNSLPLIRNDRNDHSFDAAFFSFDSFCAPHLESIISVIKSLHSENRGVKITFYCSPICHYILSIPNSLGSFQITDMSLERFFELDQNLLGANDMRRIEKLQDVIIYKSIFNPEQFKGAEILWSTIRELIVRIKNEGDRNLFNYFPIDQFILRDLSLTYKTSALNDILADQFLSEYFWLAYLVYTYLYCWEALYVPNRSLTAVFSDYSPCFTLRYSYQIANQVLRQIEMRQPYFSEPDRSQYLIIAPHNYKGILARTPDLINSLSSYVLKEDVVERLFKQLQCRITGGKAGHVYSPNKTDRKAHSYIQIQNWIRQNSDSAIFTAFTSSEDESIADSISLRYQEIKTRQLVEPIFESHLEWILYLCNLFSTDLKDCLLIIRVHPRQGADHRGLGESPTHKTLLDRLSIYEKEPNIIVVMPEENISSYYLGLQSDYILTAWSTIGFEFSMLAKPVIGAFYRTLNGSSYSFSDQPCFYRGFSLEQYKDLVLEASSKNLFYNPMHGYNSLLYLFCISYAFVSLVEEGSIFDYIVDPKPKTEIFQSSFEHSSPLCEGFRAFRKSQSSVLSAL